MKIVLVSKEYPPSRHSYGIGTYTQETALSLAKQHHDVTVICASDESAPAGESLLAGVRVIRLEDPETQAKGLRSKLGSSPEALAYRGRVAETLNELIDAGRAEIVEFPGYRGESYQWRMRKRIPMVVRMHGLVGWISKKPIDRWIPRRRQLIQFETAELLDADCVTLPADHVRSIVEKRIPRERIITIPNGIDGQSWVQRSIAGRAPDVSAEDVLYVGSLSRLKGVFDLIEAATELHKRGTWSGRLILIGASTREFDRYCKRRWGSKTNAPPHISIRSTVPRESLAPAFRSAGVCCFPSWSEAFGYAAMEAAVSGGLVVGSAGTGIAEFIRDGETGFLVHPRDTHQLCAVLDRALRLDSVRNGRGSCAPDSRWSCENSIRPT